MTQSPPKGPSPSSRPPAAVSSADGGRRITALAAGGSVLLLSATAVALWPRTYGTAATFVIDGGAHVINPVALAGRIEAALLEREGLATVAMELPAELRSPDPIGRLRAGIRVQSRAALGFSVEFRGSDPQSVQRIANRLAERAVAIVPKLVTSPEDAAPAVALATQTRAVTEFLSAHPEMTLEQPSGKPSGGATTDSALELLRTEKRQIEQRLATGATDNPYADPGQDPALLNLRLNELKITIQRREAALKQPRPASPPSVAPELTSQWRALLADLAAAQASASVQSPHSTVGAHITARADLPSSPLTPNRLVLSIVAALLSMAAAMVAYVLPRKAEPVRRKTPRSTPPGRSEPPPADRAVDELPPKRSDPPPPPAGSPGRSEPPLPRSDPPPKRSDPPPAGRPGSEPPGPIAVQRTVVLSGPSTAAGSSNAPAPTVTATRRHTSPGGMRAPGEDAASFADTSLAAPPAPATHSPPAAPLFGSRPPPGAGSYSVSSSHPPPIGPIDGVKRTSVERLSPLQSQRPPSQPTPRRSPPPVATTAQPQIVSRPPALDPDAETWAARFETVPPPAPTGEEAEEAPRKRSGRWKTQVMGSMVPLEITQMREERPPVSEPASFRPEPEPVAVVVPPPQPAKAASGVTPYDVPSGWRPNVQLEIPEAVALRDAVLQQASVRRLSIVVTGASRQDRTQMACALAFALAQSGARVLLVEADFDRPELHQALALNAPPGAGFSQQLMGRRHDERPRPWAVMRCTPNLYALVESRLRSPGLLASPEFERALQDLRDQHQVLIIHAPLTNSRTELWTLGGLTQGVVVTNDGQPTTLQFGDGALRAMLG
jgi:Mrp family chromosome partitioning ATPase